jgi:hypothetical protein
MHLIRSSDFIFFLSSCVEYNKEGNKLPSTQLVSVIPLISQYLSTSEGRLQTSSIKYIKGVLSNSTNGGQSGTGTGSSPNA